MRWILINKKLKMIIFIYLLLGTNLLILINEFRFSSVIVEDNKNKDLKTKNLNISNNEDGNIIVYFKQKSYSQSIKNLFESYGGQIKSEWNNTFNSFSGFSGILSNSSNMSLFKNNVNDGIIEKNEIIETQLNYATIQTGAVNSTWYNNGFKGNTNCSVAVLDTGINPNHIFFPEGYNSENLNGNIVGWQDFLNNDNTIALDDEGHGTFISSIISGSGVEPYNSSSPTSLNIYGRYSHSELFGNDYIAPLNYTFKIMSFNASKSNTDIKINCTWNSIVEGIENFWLELFYDSELVKSNNSQNPNELFTITHNTGENKEGIYDLYITYKKQILTIPEFSFNISLSFFPESYIEQFSRFTGVANATKIVSYKILNQSGIGYTSDLIDALESVIQNRTKYHIISVCLSIGTIGTNVSAISTVIDEVIENGILVVIAAGNSGIEGSEPLNKLALNKNAIVVGAINDEDQITSYSSMGKDIDDGIIKPDIVAPGGSKLLGHRSIIGADFKSNKTTAAYGTSIAAAIVSAAINTLIEAKWDDWENWNATNLAEYVKIIKAILLMTASETNIRRENDPDTSINEANYSPELFSATFIDELKDVNEGYGRVNIQAAIDALTNTLEVNKTIERDLVSSKDNPLEDHVFAGQIHLKKDIQYCINLILDEEDADFDVFLFSNESDPFGEPMLLSNSQDNEYLYEDEYDYDFCYYTPKKDETCIIVIKAIDGSSNFKLFVNETINLYSPELDIPEVPFDPSIGGVKNTTIMSRQEFQGNSPLKNYTLDSYKFYIEYSDNDLSNAPPQEVYISFTNNSQNYTLHQVDPLNDYDYIEGVLFESDYINFSIAGFYEYFFVGSDGKNSEKINNFIIKIEYPSDSENFPYSISFNEGLPSNWIMTGTGWDELNQSNLNDDRSRINPENWSALYFGKYHNFPTNYTYQPKTIIEEYPNGSLISPLFNLTRVNENIRVYAKFGLRVSINSGDFIDLQISLNWTSWFTLKSYTNDEREWFIEEINLTEYKGNYIQFKFNTSTDNDYDATKNRGFMVDYFVLENYSNLYQPELYFYGITPPEGSELDKYTFICEYFDNDNNYPKYVYLEMDNKNYSMYNVYGDWNASSMNIVDRGILFQKSLIIKDFSNRTFRFHVSDGIYLNKTEPFNIDNNLIKFTYPIVLELNTFQNGESIGYKFSNSDLANFYISGIPSQEDATAWLAADNTWHSINYFNEDIIYCGIGEMRFTAESLGYGENWDAELITRPLRILDDHKFYLKYKFNISIQPEVAPFYYGNNPDKCIITISTNYGIDWTVLKEYTPNSETFSGSEIIDLSKYSNEIALIKFTLHSNAQQTLPNIAYGWFLKDIYLGYDESVDVTSPIIDILNPDNNEIIHSKHTLKISIKDNIKVDESKIALYIEDQSIRSKDFVFDEDKGVLKFEWDTLQYEDGEYEIKVISYDLEGNRAEKTIKVEVNNSLFYWLLLTISGSDKSRPEIWNIWFPIILLILIIALIGFLVIMVKRKRNAIWVKGSRNQRLRKTKMEKLDKEQVIKKLEAVSLEEELKRPIILHCKYCKSWFYNDKSEFDIFCPLCGYDQIYASYNCLNCNNWYFKETPSEDYYCPKCATFEKIRKSNYQKLNIFKKKEKEINKKESVRLIRREKIEVEEILANKGRILRYFQPKPKTKYDILNL